jgi:hypothetical protein
MKPQVTLPTSTFEGCAILVLFSLLFVSITACSETDTDSPPPDSVNPSTDADAERPDSNAVDSTESENEPYFGFLQLRVENNATDDSCRQTNSCQIRANKDESVRQWLSRVREDSNLGVLHWNRPIPYEAFATSPEDEENITAFYDSKIPPALLDWIEAFQSHFRKQQETFLQVSALDGPRLRPAKQYVSRSQGAQIASEECPKLNPNSSFEIETKDGEPETINFQDTYANFLKYLYQKLKPDNFALVVEANLYKKHCPNRWQGFVELYHETYEDLRDVTGSATRLFATFTYSDILGYDLQRCTGGLKSIGCGRAPGESPYPTRTPGECYHIDPTPIEDFNRGDHLDMLGLSLYPDGLLMRVPDGPKAFEVHSLDSEGPGDCQSKLVMPEVINPWKQLDRLDWDKPIAITETSSRSCTVWQWFENESGETGLFRLPASLTTQKFWLRKAVYAAKAHDMKFMVQSLYEDFPPIGRSFLQSFENPTSFNAINLWACSGFYTRDNRQKQQLFEIWPGSSQ